MNTETIQGAKPRVTPALFDGQAAAEIDRILRGGNTAELKLEKGQLVIVEIRRKVGMKKPL